MKLATAQIQAKIGDLDYNLSNHYKMIELAAKENVDLIVFPEMSITGYCREEARELSLTETDGCLGKLKKLAFDHGMIIVAGAPVAHNNNLYIGSFVFHPFGKTELYAKQYLHAGEDDYFDSSFDFNPTVRLNKLSVNLAICADIDNPKHAENANLNGCDLYMPSIFFSAKGIEDGHTTLGKYAKQHGFAVLMSNFCGEVWNTNSGGRSAFWNEQGDLLAELPADSEGLVIVEKESNEWKTKKVNIN